MDSVGEIPHPVLAQLYAALATAQGAFERIEKNREVEITMKSGGKFKFRYADLEEITAKTRPALAANGLAVMQVVEGDRLVTILVHAGGGTVRSSMDMPTSPKGGDIKAYGAGISYLRRYALSSILCVAADDDMDEDGQEAGSQGQAPSGKTPTEPLFYEQAKFDENLAAWKSGVAEGKTTPERIVKMVESKSKLTEEQKKTILAIALPAQGDK